MQKEKHFLKGLRRRLFSIFLSSLWGLRTSGRPSRVYGNTMSKNTGKTEICLETDQELLGNSYLGN